MGTPVQIFKDHWWLYRKPGLRRFFPIPKNQKDVFKENLETAYEKIKEIESCFLPGKAIDFYVDYVDSGEMNAEATMIGNWGLIAIFRGMVLLPKDAFGRMLAHPKVVPFIGNPHLESLAGQLSEGISDNIDDLHKARMRAGRDIRPTVPNDLTRYEFAVAVSQFAFDFLVIHEVAHIATGHIEFLGSKHSPLTRQAVEMGADNSAAGIMLERIFKFGIQTPKEWLPFFATDEQKLFVWCFAIYGLFRLWGIKADRAALDSSLNYPPSGMRFAMIMGTAKLVLEAMNPILASKFKEITNDAMRELGLAIQTIGGPPLTKADLDPLYTPEGRAYYVKLTKRWKWLIPRLRRHSYVHLRNPEAK